MNKNTTPVGGSFLLCLLLMSCTKEAAMPELTPSREPAPAQLYMQIAEGNSWVYETYQRDITTEKSILLSKTDSLSVVSDTIINRRPYLLLSGSRLGSPVNLMLRFAGPDALDQAEKLYFTVNQLNASYPISEASQPEGAVSAQASVQQGGRVDVPFGSFETLVLHQKLQMLPKYGGDETAAPDRIDRAYYAPGIGLVQYVRYYPEQKLEIGMRLLRCHLN